MDSSLHFCSDYLSCVTQVLQFFDKLEIASHSFLSRPLSSPFHGFVLSYWTLLAQRNNQKTHMQVHTVYMHKCILVYVCTYPHTVLCRYRHTAYGNVKYNVCKTKDSTLFLSNNIPPFLELFPVNVHAFFWLSLKQ